MFLVATIAILITMALALARATLGPTAYDRILALSMFSTKTVLLIAVTGFLFGRPEWLDLAIVYALIGYVGTVAILRFSKFGSLAGHEPSVLHEQSVLEDAAPDAAATADGAGGKPAEGAP